MNFNGVVNIRDYRVRLSPALFPYRGKGVIQVRHVNEIVAGDTAWLRFNDLGSDFFHSAFDKRNPLNLPGPFYGAETDTCETGPAEAPNNVLMDRHGLGVVAHTAWFIPIGSPFGSVREASLAEFQRALGAAHQIGATVMNVHYGKSPGFFPKEQLVGWHVEVLSRLCQEAAETGLTIVLEHVPFGGSEQLENIVAIMDQVPLLRFHLDSGHAKLERGYDRWDEYMDRLGHKLLHVHLSENDGTADQHLPLGAAPRSTTDWPQHIKKLKATGYDGTITLEVFAPQKEYLLLSRDLLRKWWDKG